MDFQYSEEYRINLNEYIENTYLNYSPFESNKQGNIVNSFKNLDIEVLVQGCNCFCIQGKGLAFAINKIYPIALESDRKTKVGDKKKLGTYSRADITENGSSKTIINAYTQFKYSKVDRVML